MLRLAMSFTGTGVVALLSWYILHRRRINPSEQRTADLRARMDKVLPDHRRGLETALRTAEDPAYAIHRERLALTVSGIGFALAVLLYVLVLL